VRRLCWAQLLSSRVSSWLGLAHVGVGAQPKAGEEVAYKPLQRIVAVME